MAGISDLHIREWARVLPDVARLTWGIAWDRRVPLVVRVGLAGLVVYVVSPVDVVPDWIPLAGHLDDALVSVVGIRTLLRRVPERALLDHWPGDPAVLGRLIGKKLTVEGREPPALPQ